MRQLGSRSPPRGVDRREVVLQVDSRADGNDGREDLAERRSVLVILMRIVRLHEASAIHVQTARDRTAADHRHTVGRISELRPSLRQVLRTPFDVLQAPLPAIGRAARNRTGGTARERFFRTLEQGGSGPRRNPSW